MRSNSTPDYLLPHPVVKDRGQVLINAREKEAAVHVVCHKTGIDGRMFTIGRSHGGILSLDETEARRLRNRLTELLEQKDE